MLERKLFHSDTKNCFPNSSTRCCLHKHLQNNTQWVRGLAKVLAKPYRLLPALAQNGRNSFSDEPLPYRPKPNTAPAGFGQAVAYLQLAETPHVAHYILQASILPSQKCPHTDRFAHQTYTELRRRRAE